LLAAVDLAGALLAELFAALALLAVFERERLGLSSPMNGSARVAAPAAPPTASATVPAALPTAPVTPPATLPTVSVTPPLDFDRLAISPVLVDAPRFVGRTASSARGSIGATKQEANQP
jgi:hypothetical protein